MQIGDLIFAPLLRSTPWDLHLARITGFQQQQQNATPTVSFEFLRETFGESSDRFEAIFIAPHIIRKSDRNFLSLPSNETFAELQKLRNLLKQHYVCQSVKPSAKTANADNNTSSNNTIDEQHSSSSMNRQLHTVYPFSAMMEMFVKFSSICFDNLSSSSSASSLKIHIIDAWLSSFLLHLPNFLMIAAEIDAMMRNDNSVMILVDRVKSLSPFHSAFLSSLFNSQRFMNHLVKFHHHHHHHRHHRDGRKNKPIARTILVFSCLHDAELWYEFYTRVFVSTTTKEDTLDKSVDDDEEASSSRNHNKNRTLFEMVLLRDYFDSSCHHQCHDDENGENVFGMKLFLGTVEEFSRLIAADAVSQKTKHRNTAHGDDEDTENIEYILLLGDDSVETVAALAEIEVEFLENNSNVNDNEDSSSSSAPSVQLFSNVEMQHHDFTVRSNTPTVTIDVDDDDDDKAKNNKNKQHSNDDANSSILLQQQADFASALLALQLDSRKEANLKQQFLLMSTLSTAKKTEKTSGIQTRSQRERQHQRPADDDQVPKNDSSSHHPHLQHPERSKIINIDYPLGAECGWSSTVLPVISFQQEEHKHNHNQQKQDEDLNNTKQRKMFHQLIHRKESSTIIGQHYLGMKKICRWGCCLESCCCQSLPCFPVILEVETKNHDSSSSSFAEVVSDLFCSSSSKSTNRILCFFPRFTDTSSNDVDEKLEMEDELQKAKILNASSSSYSSSSSSRTNFEFVPVVFSFPSVSSSDSSSFLCHRLYSKLLKLWLKFSGSIDGIVVNANCVANTKTMSSSSIRSIGLFLQTTLLQLNGVVISSNRVLKTDDGLMEQKKRDRRFNIIASNTSSSALFPNEGSATGFHRAPISPSSLRRLQTMAFVRSFNHHQVSFPLPPASSITAIERLLFSPSGSFSIGSEKQGSSSSVRDVILLQAGGSGISKAGKNDDEGDCNRMSGVKWMTSSVWL